MIKYLSRRSGDPGDGEIDETLKSVVRTNDVPEPALARKSILLQTRQVSVAFVLVSTGKDEQC